jgi:hypothetical protein
MLEHLRRKSGARRYAVLEVVARPRPGTLSEQETGLPMIAFEVPGSSG